MKTEEVLAENVRWNLNCFYTSLDDPELDRDLERWSDAAKAFSARRRGQLHHALSDAMSDYSELAALSGKFLTYLSLRANLDTGDDAVKAKSAAIEEEVNRVFADHVEWFSHELAALDDAAIETQAQTYPFLDRHLPWVREIRRAKKHFLSEEVEAALMKRYASVGPNLWAEFRDEVEADLRFLWRGEQK